MYESDTVLQRMAHRAHVVTQRTLCDQLKAESPSLLKNALPPSDLLSACVCSSTLLLVSCATSASCLNSLGLGFLVSPMSSADLRSKDEIVKRVWMSADLQLAFSASYLVVVVTLRW